jgi:hypothetical protein
VTTLGDLALVLRSKNAGIGYLTVDVLFARDDEYEAAKKVVTRERVAAAYGIEPKRISDFVRFDEGLAIKVTFPRPHVSGAHGLGEMDLYGSGQYAPMLGIEVPYEAL